MRTILKHYVTFYSPGTLVPEETTREIESWDLKKACAIAQSITERHDSRPMGFRFSTFETLPAVIVNGNEFRVEEKCVARSGLHFLNGVIETIAEIEARNLPDEKILLDNMRANKENRVITTRTPWRNTTFFRAGDKNLDSAGNILCEG